MKIYLSVLAFTDTSMLMSIFLISKQFRDNAHSHEHELYWKAFGLVQWFHIAFGKFWVSIGWVQKVQSNENFVVCFFPSLQSISASTWRSSSSSIDIISPRSNRKLGRRLVEYQKRKIRHRVSINSISLLSHMKISCIPHYHHLRLSLQAETGFEAGRNSNLIIQSLSFLSKLLCTFHTY